MKIIVLDDNSKVDKLSKFKEWDDIVDSFSESDFYHKFAYLRACQIHGDGEPLLFYNEEDKFKILLACLKRDISNDDKFSLFLDKKSFFDLQTPYGYGGFLVENFDKNKIKKFFEKFYDYCKKKNIVSLFLRFNPLIQNQNLVKNFCKLINLKQTVLLDTSSEEKIVTNMSRNHRNETRKLKKYGAKIFCDKGENLNEFLKIYEETMIKKNASEYYFFKKEYFEYLIKNLKENLRFFYCTFEDKIISSFLIFFDKNSAHYSLGGTRQDSIKLAPNKFLVYEIAMWLSNKGIKKFHLGGGIEKNDSLFFFKKKFNKNGLLDFYIGSIIFDKKKFDYLLNIRKLNDKKFDENNNFLIKYRYRAETTK
ncbi:MAG: GNAT family N-acetyltransferase [Oscillospiraceae bacterium]|jgi:lipid II:glycine glycyltransferase (peptidoglycan interpeptide bridge formation enzyme)|nr:GNAT family N-acetyltransferase [Oscillospiraceae bacterium]